MRTNVELDGTLVKKAMDLTNISTKRALINKALEELIKSVLTKFSGKPRNYGPSP